MEISHAPDQTPQPCQPEKEDRGEDELPIKKGWKSNVSIPALSLESNPVLSTMWDARYASK